LTFRQMTDAIEVVIFQTLRLARFWLIARKGSFQNANEKVKYVCVGVFVCDQWFLPLLINGENGVLGFVAVCFGLEQVFGDCSAIDRD